MAKRRQSQVENPVTKNLTAIICVILAIIIGVNIFNAAKKSRMANSTGIEAALAITDNRQRGTEEITEGIDNYLSNSDFYKAAYNRGEKIIAYPPLDNTCPFGQAFMKAFESAMSNPQFTADYKFIAFEPARGNAEFYTKCHTLCVINPTKKELFYFNGVSPTIAEKFPDILNKLKDW